MARRKHASQSLPNHEEQRLALLEENAPAESYELTAAGFHDPEEEARFFFGEGSDEEWAGAQEAFEELRQHIDEMQWFSIGPNSVGAEKHGEKWSQLVLAPRDAAHEKELEETLLKLRIYPFPETENNVRTLVIENRRDIALLRAGYIFSYLINKPNREERDHAIEQMKVDRERLEAEYLKRTEERRVNEEIRVSRELFARYKEEERQRLILAFFEAIPLVDRAIIKARPERRDTFFQFPYGPREPVMRGERRTQKEAGLEDETDTTLPEDEALEKFAEEFRSGRLNEDTLERDVLKAAERRREQPNLSLFPRKYRYVFPEGKKRRDRGYLEEAETKRKIDDEEIKKTVFAFSGGEGEVRNTAFTELALMHRQLILYLIREVLLRHVNADPDDLFQAALVGLAYAADNYQPEANESSRFRSYAIPCMEGYMRRVASLSRSIVRVPVHVAEERAEFYRAEQGVRGANPAVAPDRRDIAAALHTRGVTKRPTIHALDNFIKRTLLRYSETDIEEVEDEVPSPADVSLLGEFLYIAASQESSSDAKELRRVMNEVLGTLTPREERIIRLRFGFDEQTRSVADSVYRTLGQEFGMSEPEVFAHIRALTERGNLAYPGVFESLDERDKAFATRYRELLDVQEENSLRAVGQVFSVTQERLRQLEARALRKLKHPARSRKLIPFLPPRPKPKPPYR